jgi:rfaE bifunctional protein nucleotidyltransferase chain/domain
MRYAFDIDNTLVHTVGSDYENSTPIQHRIDRVNHLFDEGHTIYLFTARGMASGKDYREFTTEQMEKFGVKYHRLITGKPDVDIFIDDKAISVQDWDKYKNGVIWTNGCYDVLHIGHIRLFQYCKQLAEEHDCQFVVGIDSDRRVKELKGNSRPINCEYDRVQFLLSIKGIDRVCVYETDDELEKLMQILTPRVMVVGDDYKDKYVIGSNYATEVKFFPKVVGYSTTSTVNKIIEMQQRQT